MYIHVNVVYMKKILLGGVMEDGEGELRKVIIFFFFSP